MNSDKNPRKIIVFVTRVDQIPLTGKDDPKVQIAFQGSLKQSTRAQIKKAIADGKVQVTENRYVLG